MLDNCRSLKCLTTAGCKNLVSYVRGKPEQLCVMLAFFTLCLFHRFYIFTFLRLLLFYLFYFFNYKVMMPFTRS